VNRNTWLWTSSVVVLFAAVAAIGYLSFGAGFAQGASSQIAAGTQAQQGPALGGYAVPYFWHPYPFFGLGCLGPLLAVFLFFLVLRTIRFLFWGSRGEHWRHMRRGWHHGWDEEAGVPPMFQAWHDRAHVAARPGKADMD
jgi:hypothetical protein